MITRVLVLALVLAITLAVSIPALAQNDVAINDKGVVSIGGDVVLGKCSDLLQHRDEVPDLMDAVRACEKAGYSAPLTETGGPPIILVPIALLVAGGLLIRLSVDLSIVD
jgi:hypothetical protein